MINKIFKVTDFFDYEKVFEQYTTDFIKNSLCVKLEETEKNVKIVVAESKKEEAKKMNSVHFPKTVSFIWVDDKSFAEFIGSVVEKNKNGSKKIINCKTETESFKLENISADSPVINIINAICLEAIRKKASDIHIQNVATKINVRFRIDGVLHTVKSLENILYNGIVSRIKIMSGLNVMESRLPQDGRMSVSLEGHKIDFRVSIVPVVNGQSVVLRLFNNKDKTAKLQDLGFSKNNYEKLEKALKIPNGLILATGPTGSGKTTTLHALLNEMDVEHLKITTIEDPVERNIDGIEQIQVNDELGLSFENILRRVLRQDPDVIMVGEIRDSETASLAIRASLTGHTILSTLHTNDSFSAITRLKDLGVESYLIASVLKYCIAQRLVRKICKKCYGKGCDECNFTGYSGRTVVSEILEVTEKVQQQIAENKTDSQIKSFCIKNGFKLLSYDAKNKVESKITKLEEIKKEIC